MTGKTVKLLVFDLKAELGHFRRPDTTATHATYPFITRTALRGLLGSLLGMDHWQGEAWTGLRIMRPIKTRTQQVSLLGKGYFGGGPSFNRPTSVELVVEPHYRIYYCGDHFEQLREYLQQGFSVYHTYLGSAFAPTKPRFIETVESVEESPKEIIKCCSILPSHRVGRLEIQPEHKYMRAGGIPYKSLGDRRFEGTMNFIYEPSGKTLSFAPDLDADGVSTRWMCLPTGEWVSLW